MGLTGIHAQKRAQDSSETLESKQHPSTWIYIVRELPVEMGRLFPHTPVSPLGGGKVLEEN
jgi:hypothetical protein